MEQFYSVQPGAAGPAAARAIINEVKKAVCGKDEIIERVMLAVLAGGHVLLEDMPGVGKTTLALAFSKPCSFLTSASSLHLTSCRATSPAIPSIKNRRSALSLFRAQ